MEQEHASVLDRRDSDHNSELRDLEALKIRREREYLDKIKDLNDKHDGEMRAFRDE